MDGGVGTERGWERGTGRREGKLWLGYKINLFLKSIV